MHLSENEQLLILQKKEEIRIVTLEILELVNKEIKTQEDSLPIKKKFLHILSLLHILASYGKPNLNLEIFRERVIDIFDNYLSHPPYHNKFQIEYLCIIVNSIDYSYGHWPSFFKATISLASVEVKK
jgi:hypothetical protein